MVKRLLFGLLFLISITAYSQTNYYVKNGGSDSNTGLSDAQAWETIAKVKASTFQPGDSILFNRGDTWKESLTVNQSGTALSPITYGAYGTGPKPIITVKDTLVGWSDDTRWTEYGTGSNIWMYKDDSDNIYPRLWINGVEEPMAQTKILVDVDSPWRFDTSTDSLYVYSTANPGNAASGITSIEVSWTYKATSPEIYRQYAIRLTSKDYIHLTNLDIRGGSTGIRLTNCDYFLIDSCDIGYDGFYGLVATVSSVDSTSNGGIVRKCNFDTHLTLKLDFYDDYFEADDGIQIWGNCDDWEIDSCYFKNWRHSGIYHFITSESAYETNNLSIHHNYFTAPDIQSGRGMGIGTKPGYGTGHKIYNNYIYNTNEPEQISGNGVQYYYNVIDKVNGHIGRATTYWGGLALDAYSGGEVKNCEIYNNIIANCYSYGIDMITHNANEFTGNKIYNNILYNNDTINGIQIWIQDAAVIENNGFKNNLIYKEFHTDSLVYFGADETDDYYKSITEFNEENGTAGHSILSNISVDPLFDGATFELLSTSPAIDAGVDVGLPYFGKAPDIGAYEFTGFPIATTGLGWENHYAKKNFKDDVNFEKGFSVEGVPIVFSGGAPVSIPGLTASSSELNILDGATITTDELNYLDGVTSAIQTQIDALVPYSGATTAVSLSTDGITYSLYDGATQLAPAIPASGQGELSDYVPLLVDTIPLFVFGGGGGNTGDTTVFTTSTIYGAFFNAGSDTLVVTELRACMTPVNGSDTLDIDILWDVNLNDASPTKLNTTPLPVNSSTTGTVDTVFDNAKIPPGVWVWCETPAVIVGRKPTLLIVQLSGYKIPTY
jgi:hypothetical protein